jgi:mannose-1-phosphate guanylyltransferase
MFKNKNLYAVILAGGGGTRLWPKSRDKSPKQFLKLTGKDSLTQMAAQRSLKFVDWSRVIVVTNKNYLSDIKKQLPKVPEKNIICEPERRDTAMAMLIGALYAKSLNPNAVIINSASDHVVTNLKEFIKVIKLAADTAEKDHQLVAVGITPTHPSSAYGYIKTGKEIKKLDDYLSLYHVDSFKEKPNSNQARRFMATGRYFWNANMYVWRADNLKEEFKLYKPKLYQLTKKLDSMSNGDFHKALVKIYDQAEKISIDYAISEKTKRLVLIPGDIGWSDIGDWKVVYDLSKKDKFNNVIIGKNHVKNSLIHDSKNNLIHTNNKLVALAGVENMVIVDTDEVLMICPKSKSQEVKKLVEIIKKERKRYL